MDATNSPVLGVSSHAILQVSDGLVAEAWAVVDVIALLRQLNSSSGHEPAGDPGPPSPPAGAAPAESAVEAVQRFCAAYAAGDEEALAGVIAEDWVCDPAGAASSPGRAGFVENYVSWRAVFPDARQTVEDMVAAGDLVMVCVLVEGTQQGAFGDIPPSRRPVAFVAFGLWLVRGGQLAELWSVGDYQGLVRQLRATATPPA